MRKLWIAIALLAPMMFVGKANAQSHPTYYYCYAYENSSNRMWISAVRYGDNYSFTEYNDAYARSVRNAYNVQYFSATGCRPYYENTDQSGVEDDRNQFFSNNQGKTVIFFN